MINFKGLNENSISSRWKKRFAELPNDIQQKIKELDNKDPREYQLKVIKKTKCKPKEGDVFLVSSREGIYFYGRVLKTQIKHITNDIFINGNEVTPKNWTQRMAEFLRFSLYHIEFDLSCIILLFKFIRCSIAKP